MKASLKSLAADMRPAIAEVPKPAPETPSYRKAETRIDTRQVSAHFPAEAVKSFRVLAAAQDMDVGELLAEGINMVFERYGVPDRIDITSGRRKRS